jgi:hypothetical protein
MTRIEESCELMSVLHGQPEVIGYANSTKFMKEYHGQADECSRLA